VPTTLSTITSGNYVKERNVDDVLEEDFTPPFKVVLTSGVATKIRDGIPRASAAEKAGLGLPYAGSVEAGGLMMGEALGDNTFRVTDVSLTIGETDRYYLDPAEHESFRASFLAKFSDADRYGLIGSWHSHPSGNPVPSQADLNTLKTTMDHPSTNLDFKVMLIVCRDEKDTLLTGGKVLHREPRVLSNIEVSIEPGWEGHDPVSPS
jgi:proteasome lid subunit RPN8/RPN11